MKWKALVLILILMFLVVTPVSAAKKRVWKATTVAKSAINSAGKFGVSAKLTGWKQYLNVSFKGVVSTSGVTYELIYNGNDTEQGVYGTVKPSEGNVTRSIFLGTCSHGACVSHKNISNIRLTITYKTTDGQSMVKRYKVKY